MKHTFGHLFRRLDSGLRLASFYLLVLAGGVMLASSHALCAAQTTTSQDSIITPQLLTEVDQLLATDSLPQQTSVTQGMGPLVDQAQGGLNPDALVHATRSSDTQLNVTAIPLPNAFGMAGLLLFILFLAYVIRRVRLSLIA